MVGVESFTDKVERYEVNQDRDVTGVQVTQSSAHVVACFVFQELENNGWELQTKEQEKPAVERTDESLTAEFVLVEISDNRWNEQQADEVAGAISEEHNREPVTFDAADVANYDEKCERHQVDPTAQGEQAYHDEYSIDAELNGISHCQRIKHLVGNDTRHRIDDEGEHQYTLI